MAVSRTTVSNDLGSNLLWEQGFSIVMFPLPVEHPLSASAALHVLYELKVVSSGNLGLTRAIWVDIHNQNWIIFMMLCQVSLNP